MHNWQFDTLSSIGRYHGIIITPRYAINRFNTTLHLAIPLLNYLYNIVLYIYCYPEKMAEDTTSSRLLVDKPNTKSQVWRHFALVPDTDGEVDKPKCKLCFEEVIARFGNTSNLFAHLRTSTR